MAKSLSEWMEFDHPVRIDTDGTVTDSDLDSIHAPSIMDEEIDSDKWEFFTHGYSGQHGYNGPIMHNSEYIGGGLERDILATPGVYVAVVADWSPNEEEGETWDDDRVEGWAILRLKEKEPDAPAE